MQTIMMNINGMTCLGCVNSVKSLLDKIPGVNDADVSLENGQVTIQYNAEKTDVNQFKEAIMEAGFEVNISEETTQQA